MADKSAIEWTDASWTPIRARNLKTGKLGWHCEHATTGCEFCYSEGFNKRLGTGLQYKPGHRKDIEIFLDEDMLKAPLRWKKPRMIFVCSMTDAFGDFVKDEWLDKMFAVMALCPQHTFQVLTKRAEGMRDYLTSKNVATRIAHHSILLAGPREDRVISERVLWSIGLREKPVPNGFVNWPLPNLWLGVSCERQQEADERIPFLLQMPAAVRFVSAEPLLGAIDLLGNHWLTQFIPAEGEPFPARLDWVIVGGESGHNARPFHIDWAESIVAQCAYRGVACFVKQLGACAMSDGYPMHYADRKGGDWDEWPESLRVRQFPVAAREVAA
jgi:protein gp37